MIHIFSVHSITKKKKKPRRAFSKDVYMLFTSREVRTGKNCTRGFRSALKTEGTVFPSTDGHKLVNNIFFSRKLKEMLAKITQMIESCNLLQWRGKNLFFPSGWENMDRWSSRNQLIRFEDFGFRTAEMLEKKIITFIFWK